MKSILTSCCCSLHLFLISVIIITLPQLTHAQTVDEIKQNKAEYIWGEGVGQTLKEADNAALADLIGQISTQVESNFQKTVVQTNLNDKINFKETVNDIVKTYSNATLNNTMRMTISESPVVKVFRFIKRSEIDKIFEARKLKIINLAQSGEEQLANLKIADALRYFYWSQTLLRSHPNASEITFVCASGTSELLITWLPQQINSIFSNLAVTINEVQDKGNYKNLLLDILYKNAPVSNFDYTYWSGQDWSNIISARDGLGVAEVPKSYDATSLRINAEYVFENESNIDLELRDIMQKLPEVSYKNCQIIARHKSDKPTTPTLSTVTNAQSTSSTGSLTLLTNTSEYEKVMNKVVEAINNRTYSAAGSHFTAEGLSVFQSLLGYGNARILKLNPLKFYQFNDMVICRSIPMSFHFKTNNRSFVEEVVFSFDKNNKICNLNFALDKKAVDDIAGKNEWSEKVRMQLINFMENYKTAYALKRLDYIESIFSDDALIITGRVTRTATSPELRYANNEIVRYNRQTKEQYIKNLKYCFNSNEYINLKLTGNTVKESGITPNVYGIQIKQDYFSSSYGDTGYLFLLIDFNNADTPQIHVRTWQPRENPIDSIYGLGNF